jgi:phosphate transport system substrate-binding protein
MNDIRRAGAFAVAVLLIATLSSCAVNEAGDTPSDLSGTIDGAGSSAQGSVQETWISSFQRNNAFVTVNYDPSGSGAGREAFLAGGVDFAGSDSALNEDELAGEFLACVPGTRAIDLPVYISPIAIVFNVDGVDSLNLDAETLARIFSQDIDSWDDPAIAALNSGVRLPASRITAVHRSDDSGTTKNFVDYLYQTAPRVWEFEPKDAFPVRGGEAAQGNSGVISAVRNGTNTIGYADASKVDGLDVASLKVGGEFVQYTAEAAAAIVDASLGVAGREPNDLAITIDRTSTAPGVYPLVLLSYLIVCQEYLDPEAAELVREYVTYVSSPKGQADAARAAGSAPISDALSARVSAAVRDIR